MRHVIFLVGALVVLATVPACKEGEAKAESNEPTEKSGPVQTKKTVNVKVETLTPTSLKEEVVAHGVTNANRAIKYSAELPGKLEYLSADVGDTVKNGQVLARIDFRTLKAQAAQAEANHTLAKSTFDRLSTLRDEELVSQQKLDESQSGLLGTEAMLEIAKANLAKSSVKASFRGIVTTKYVERGEYVAPGMPLYDVVDYRTILLEAQLAETEVAEIAQKARVTIDIAALNQSFEGEVDTVVPTADSVSKTFTLRVKIDNPDLKILVGMSAKLRVSTQNHENVLVVSQSVVLEETGKRYVYVIDGKKAVKRKIELGAVDGDRVVIKQGVAEGEALVVLGQRDLTDGQEVRITN